MNLNENRPDAKQAFLTAGFTFASLIIMSVGGSLVVWSSPRYLEQLNAYRVIGMFTGLLVAIFALRFAWSMGNVTVGLWTDYRDRLLDWHNAELDMYLAQSGVETTTEISQLELSPAVAGHVLLTALAIQYRLTRGERYSNAPWSIRGLNEKLYLSGTSNAVLLGEITGTRPELMSERLAQVGIVRNRKPGVAGDWSVNSYEEIFDLIAKNWSKIR